MTVLTSKYSQNSQGCVNQSYSHDTPDAIEDYISRKGSDESKVFSNELAVPVRDVEPGGDEKPGKTFEDILSDLGCFGPFQVLTLFSYLFLEIAAAFVVFIPIFVGRSSSTFENCTEQDNATDSTHQYSLGENDTFLTDEAASSKVTFSIESLFGGFQHVLESPFEYESVVDEWDLKCDRSWIPDVFTSCLMAGMIAGNVIASQMADWYGRRRTYLSILIILLVGTAMSALSPTIYFYAIARFIAGAGFCGFINVSCMAVMEFMTPEWRSLANMVGPMGEGIILLSVLAYFIRPWRMLYLATLTPYLLIIPIYFLLPESPRWLLRNKKVNEAHDVLNYMARINRRTPVSREVLELLRRQEESATEMEQKRKRITYLDFIKTKQLLTTSLYLFAVWFSWNVAYYGISYNMRNVPGNPYFNLGLVGVANALGQRSSMPASDRFGRRKAVLYGMTLSAVFLVTLAVLFLTMEEVNSTVILIGCFVGLFGLACTRAAARLLSGESFPTAVRTMGLGMGGLGANFAGLVTPQVAYLGSKWPSMPFFIFAIVAVMGSLVVFMMKETNGTPLSDEVQLGKTKHISFEVKLEKQEDV